MRRNTEEFKELASKIAFFVGLLLMVIIPIVLIYLLVERYDLTEAVGITLTVIALFVALFVGGFGWVKLTTKRARKLNDAIDQVGAWALDAGFSEGKPESLPKEGHVPDSAKKGKRPGYIAKPRGIDLMPFTLYGDVRVVKSYTRRIQGIEVALAHVEFEREIGDQSGQPTSVVRFTVVIASGLRDLPLAWIEPQGKADRALLAMGAKDVDVESAAFNDQWRVYATDVRAAHGFLSPRVIQHLIDSSEGEHSIAMSGEYIVTAKGGWLWPVGAVAHMVHLVTGVVETLPEAYRTGRVEDEPVRGAVVAEASDTNATSRPIAAESRSTTWVRGGIAVMGLALFAYPFFTIPGPGEDFHWYKLVMLFGGPVLAIASGRLARFIVGDRHAVRRST
jgi:hypothetical protein